MAQLRLHWYDMTPCPGFKLKNTFILQPCDLGTGLVNASAGSDSGHVSNDTFVGGYAINSTSTALSDGFPHWVKPPNCNWDDDVYLYWDGFFGYWQVGGSLHVDALMVCFQEEDYSPIACSQWYDGYLHSMSNMYLYNCTAAEMVASCASTFTVDSTGRTVGIVMTVLFFIVCGVILLWFYRKNMREKAEVTFSGDGSGPDGVEDRDFGGAPVIGHRATDSGAALTTNAAIRTADFSPLNVEETTTAKSGDTGGSTKGDGVIPPESDDVEEAVGIDARRMSAHVIATMQRDIEEWTDALIKDPREAARRYSRDTDTGGTGSVPVSPVPVEQLDLGAVDETKTVEIENQEEEEEIPEPLDLFDDDVTAKSTDQLVPTPDSNEEDEERNDVDSADAASHDRIDPFF